MNPVVEMLRGFYIISVRLCGGLHEISHRASEKNKNTNITIISNTARMVKIRLLRPPFAHKRFLLCFMYSSSVRKKMIIMMVPILFCIAGKGTH